MTSTEVTEIISLYCEPDVSGGWVFKSEREYRLQKSECIPAYKMTLTTVEGVCVSGTCTVPNNDYVIIVNDVSTGGAVGILLKTVSDDVCLAKDQVVFSTRDLSRPNFEVNSASLDIPRFDPPNVESEPLTHKTSKTSVFDKYNVESRKKQSTG
ncbi:tlp20 [Clostera anastomosis granulovirus A]|uniref:Tlp20 n=1 Tax=Clostera anastomosis granulovirus A TaxID=1986289 RepID=U5KAV7_9BBAC|nr:tlp20 [Clostera anastomosis granulovirus Henan]AGQ20347.1 tlp20 [Clostera anastomosis granulovirus Henan]